MIHLHRIGMVNWHLMAAQDVEVRGDVGVIGENRSGKSTLLDLIQVVITGNNGRYLRLNASANESGRKRGMRSVHAYCLGRLGPDDVLRKDGALTTIFLVFTGQEAPFRPTTIGLALEASPNETSERVLAQFIAHGVALSVLDFIETDANGTERARDWALVKPLLEAKCRQAGGEFNTWRDEPGKYVTDYMLALATGGRFVNVGKFQKAFVNAISFEQIPSATEFVRRYLLDEHPFKIGQLRESIATYRRLQEDIRRAGDKLTRLKSLRTAIGAFKADLVAHDRERWIAARARLDQSFAENRQFRRQRDRALAEQAEALRTIEDYDCQRKELTEDLDGVNVAIQMQGQGLGATYASQRKAAVAERRVALDGLSDLHRAVVQGTQVAKHRPYLPLSAKVVLERLDSMSAASGMAAVPAWPQDPQALATLLDDPALILAPLQEHAQRGEEAAIKDQVPLEKEIGEIKRQIAEIDDKGVALNRNVEALAAEMSSLGWRPRIVCTLLRVTDDTWRDAVEALLGPNREAIIVADEYVEDAVRHLQRKRVDYRGCRIVNSRKIDPRETSAQPGTLASVLSSDDPLAMAFVLRRIGNVRLAHTIADLHRPGRAIMRDGTYDDGLTVEMRQPEGYKIGAGAGRLALAALKTRQEDLAEDLREAKERAVRFKSLGGSLSILSAALGRGAELLAYWDQAQRTKEQLDRIDADLQGLQRNINPDLQRRQQELKAKLELYDREKIEAVTALANAKKDLGTATGKLGGTEQQTGSTWHLRVTRQRFREVRILLHRSQSHPAYAEAIGRNGGDFGKLSLSADKGARDAKECIERGQGSIFDAYVDFHQHFGLPPDFTRDKVRITLDLEPWVEQGIERIETVDLVRWGAEAEEAAEKTRNIFQHSFAFTLRDRFDAMKASLEDMNRTLRGHDFHYESYRFTSQPVELYREVVALVEASRNDDSIFAHLFDSDAGLNHPHAKALKTVQELLLDDSRDISEFEDYRKYFAFNLIMKDEKSKREVDLESRRGTGSGAEQQVPFYVAIGTALATAYHGKKVGCDAAEKGIGLAVFDEAFSKLDGRNQKACMDYYEKLGLQVVVAAPFEKRATLYETMDSFVETIRTGDLIEVEAYEVRDRTRRAFSEANPANLDMEEFRRFMTGTTAAQ